MDLDDDELEETKKRNKDSNWNIKHWFKWYEILTRMQNKQEDDDE